MLARKYAQALYNASTAEGARPDSSAKHFVEYLKARGQYKLLPMILSEYRKLLEKAARQRRTIVRVASEKDARTYSDEIEKVLRELPGVEKPERVIDERVIGGVRVESHGAIYDRTYRNQLLTLFQEVIE